MIFRVISLQGGHNISLKRNKKASISKIYLTFIIKVKKKKIQIDKKKKKLTPDEKEMCCMIDANVCLCMWQSVVCSLSNRWTNLQSVLFYLYLLDFSYVGSLLLFGKNQSCNLKKITSFVKWCGPFYKMRLFLLHFCKVIFCL